MSCNIMLRYVFVRHAWKTRIPPHSSARDEKKTSASRDTSGLDVRTCSIEHASERLREEQCDIIVTSFPQTW